MSKGNKGRGGRTKEEQKRIKIAIALREGRPVPKTGRGHPWTGQATSWRHTVPAYFGAVGGARDKAERLRKAAAIRKVSDRSIYDKPIAVPRKAVLGQ